ncbi:MAG: hypothetical protein KGZ53_07010 [Peptococcaceae bacterium]|nr:hypothetical protein [Peptococcaceae bacterium]
MDNSSVADHAKLRPQFDSGKVAEEEKYDGYYSIVTSELDMSDAEVIETYRGLWVTSLAAEIRVKQGN